MKVTLSDSLPAIIYLERKITRMTIASIPWRVRKKGRYPSESILGQFILKLLCQYADTPADAQLQTLSNMLSERWWRPPQFSNYL